MKMMKYKLLGFLFMFSGIIYASDADNPSQIDEMHLQKWKILVSEAQLTPKEIELVQPVFMEYENAVWALHKKNREFFKAAFKDLKKVKPNFAELNDRYANYDFQDAQLFKNYHSKLRKLLQPETLFKYYHAEREFKRKLLRDFHDHGPHDGPKPQ
jgi:hypothetical protein